MIMSGTSSVKKSDYHLYEHVREKTNNLGPDQARHKLVCTVTEAG